MSLLDTALMQCEQFLRFYENEELEDLSVQEMLDIDWDSFLQQYYLLCQYVLWPSHYDKYFIEILIQTMSVAV